MAHSSLGQTEKPAVLPWERFDWSAEQKKRIFCDWGLYAIQKKNIKTAERCYDECLEIDPAHAKALYMRSYCKREIADSKSALDDARAAAKIDRLNPDISMAVCDAVYEMNDLEKSKAKWHNNTLKYGAAIGKRFINRLDVVDENMANCFGESLGSFILKNKNNFTKIFEELRRRETGNVTPNWKTLVEQGKCDVVSIFEDEGKEFSPLSLARRDRWFRIFYQIYFKRNWIDMAFMRDLRKRDDWIIPQFVGSKPVLMNLLGPNYNIVKTFIKMLHVRSPLYDKYGRKFRNKKLLKQHREGYLYFMQYRTRRAMITVLRNIRNYSQAGEIERMTNYIESFMGDYVVIKTHRVMPWRFEFVNEVYNTLALAIASTFYVSEKHRHRPSLKALLSIRVDVSDQPEGFKFGDKSSRLKDERAEKTRQNYIDYFRRLQKRQRFSKYSIEKCYLWYEASRTHLKHFKYDKCVMAAKKAIEESRNCNSQIWAFLNMMLIVKSHAALNKIEYCKDALQAANAMVKRLKDPRLIEFVEFAIYINETDLNMKRLQQSSDFTRRRRGRTASNCTSTNCSMEDLTKSGVPSTISLKSKF